MGGTSRPINHSWSTPDKSEAYRWVSQIKGKKEREREKERGLSSKASTLFLLWCYYCQIHCLVYADCNTHNLLSEFIMEIRQLQEV